MLSYSFKRISSKEIILLLCHVSGKMFVTCDPLLCHDHCSWIGWKRKSNSEKSFQENSPGEEMMMMMASLSVVVVTLSLSVSMESVCVCFCIFSLSLSRFCQRIFFNTTSLFALIILDTRWMFTLCILFVSSLCPSTLFTFPWNLIWRDYWTEGKCMRRKRTK